MKVLKFPAQRSIQPAVPTKQRRKMIREIEPAMRLFPHVHGAAAADLAQIDKRLAEAYAKQFRRAAVTARRVAFLFDYCAYWIETGRDMEMQRIGRLARSNRPK